MIGAIAVVASLFYVAYTDAKPTSRTCPIKHHQTKISLALATFWLRILS
jgi:hypothetical protein